MRLHDFKDEEVVSRDQRRIVQAALEVGVTFANKGRFDFCALFRREAELFELVDFGTRCVADADCDVSERSRR